MDSSSDYFPQKFHNEFASVVVVDICVPVCACRRVPDSERLTLGFFPGVQS